jgi:hypothetical protein
VLKYIGQFQQYFSYITAQWVFFTEETWSARQTKVHFSSPLAPIRSHTQMTDIFFVSLGLVIRHGSTFLLFRNGITKLIICDVQLKHANTILLLRCSINTTDFPVLKVHVIDLPVVKVYVDELSSARILVFHPEL